MFRSACPLQTIRCFLAPSPCRSTKLKRAASMVFRQLLKTRHDKRWQAKKPRNISGSRGDKGKHRGRSKNETIHLLVPTLRSPPPRKTKKPQDKGKHHGEENANEATLALLFGRAGQFYRHVCASRVILTPTFHHVSPCRGWPGIPQSHARESCQVQKSLSF